MNRAQSALNIQVGRAQIVWQVVHNQESQRRQYGLADRAHELGFSDVRVIDDDLGRSGSGFIERPGFQRLVAEVCSGEVGAIFCIERALQERMPGSRLRVHLEL